MLLSLWGFFGDFSGLGSDFEVFKALLRFAEVFWVMRGRTKKPAAESDRRRASMHPRRIADQAISRRVAPLQSPLPLHPAPTKLQTRPSDIAAIPRKPGRS